MPVKPLNAQSLNALLKRIQNGCEGEIRSLRPLAPTTIEITLSVQDSARGFDWINLSFIISGVRDAKLLSDNKLKLLDMKEGITLEIAPDGAGFAVGSYAGRVAESPLYIKGESVAYEEREFTE